ncbi:MAG TPA: hypothetical protein VH591_21220 [Ktedonobacterales bacterium]|jgi:hypothetical protein
MPGSQVDQKLLVIAQFETMRVKSHPGIMSHSVLSPYLTAFVHFDPQSDIEVATFAPSSPSPSTSEVYRVFPRYGSPKIALTPMNAAEILFNFWYEELGILERENSAAYAQAVQTIEREYFRASEVLGAGLPPVQSVSARGGGNTSIFGNIGCILASIVTIIILAAIITSLVGHVLGGNSSVATGTEVTGSNNGVGNTAAGNTAAIDSCLQQPGFAGSTGQPTAGADFQDVGFPDASVSYFGDTFTDGSYQFQIVEVCTVTASADNIRSFYASSMPSNGWTQTDHFPYAGDPNRGCGDPYCWVQGSSPTRFASLEKVTVVGADVVYELRLGTLP